MESMARSGDQYFDKITSIQESMNTREKRRLELERELFSYSRSDRRISQIKCSKLRSYLKEICDREARAKMRNLELLRDVECIEIGMKEYSPDHGPLKQQKVEFFKKVSRFMEARKTMEQDLVLAKVETVQKQNPNSLLPHPAECFPQPPAVILMGRQTSKRSNTDADSAIVHSYRPLHHSTNCIMHSHERLPSGLLKDFRAGGEDAASNPEHLSDGISDSNDSPDCCGLSDKHERAMAMLPSVRVLTDASGNLPSRNDDEPGRSPLVTLTGPEKNLSSSSSSSMKAKNPAAENTDPCEVAHRQPIMEDGEGGPSHLLPQTTLEEGAQYKPGRHESVSTASSDLQLSESSESDLSITLSQSELEENLPDGVASVRSATPGASDDDSHHSPESSKNAPQSNRDSSAPVVTLESLSKEGLFYLLDNIEGRLHCEQACLYRDSSVDGRQLNRIISLCNARADVNDEDLEACGAVILGELQRLSLSTEKGCLLPQDLVSAHQSSTDPNEISTSLPPDAARLWDRWFKHALLLKERRVLTTERLVQLFTPLLLECNATYGHQAKELLRTLVSRSSEEWPSAEDESDLSSSCGPAALLADGDLKPARPVQKQYTQELQSTEEESQDESPVESVPIRETKAYQLLKQSAMQEGLQSSEEEEEEEEEEDDDDLSGINHGHEEDLGRAKRSSHQDPYPRKENMMSKAQSVLQSKAFWGTSDESSSDIEAALRPQPLNTNDDDTDDFYD